MSCFQYATSAPLSLHLPYDAVVLPNNFVVDVAYNRFVARSPQAMMNGYGRGHLRPDRAEIAKAPKAAGLDAGSDGRDIRAG